MQDTSLKFIVKLETLNFLKHFFSRILSQLAESDILMSQQARSGDTKHVLTVYI